MIAPGKRVEPDVGAAPAGPLVAFRTLDTVWIQVTGTLCNIACRHCFVNAGPKRFSVPTMSRAEVLAALVEAEGLGAREAYYTGGEPFLHPDLRDLVDLALERMPLTILTNALLIDDETAAWAGGRFRESRYSFDLRVSLDGMTAEQNDRVRGHGVFDRVIAALGRLARAGMTPVVTVVEHEEGLRAAEARAEFTEFLRVLGFERPRAKFLPLLRIGREAERTRGYARGERLGAEPIPSEIEETLLCASSRTVTSRGVYTCPILVEAPSARLGDSLIEASRDLGLRWPACYTCVVDGLRCAT